MGHPGRLMIGRHTIWSSRRAGILSCDRRPPGCQGQPTASLSHRCTADRMMKSSPRPPRAPLGHYSGRRTTEKKNTFFFINIWIRGMWILCKNSISYWNSTVTTSKSLSRCWWLVSFISSGKSYVSLYWQHLQPLWYDIPESIDYVYGFPL